MSKLTRIEDLKRSLPGAEMKENSPRKEVPSAVTLLTEDAVDEIVGSMYLRIGELETSLLSLSRMAGQPNTKKALRKLQYVSEKMTCYIRERIAWLGLFDDENTEFVITDESQDESITIEETSFGYTISCPYRLPSKNSYRVNEFWWGSLEKKIKRFAKVSTITHMDRAFIVYLDRYPKGCPAAHITDADNQDIKRVTDVIKEVFLRSDDSLHLWILQMGLESASSSLCSEIHVVDRMHLREWLTFVGPQIMEEYRVK